MENTNNVIEINMKELLKFLFRKIWIIVLITVICVIGARFYTQNYMTPYYSSSAKLYVLHKQTEQQTTISDLQMSYVLAQDYMVLITSRPVMEKVINNLQLDMSHRALAGSISVYTHENTRILEITAYHTDPNMAKLIVDTVAEVSSESMVNIMGIDKVNIIEEGEYPYWPVGPDYNRNMRLAGVIGFGLTTVILSLVYLLNDTIKTPEDIEKQLGLITLGTIPMESNYRNRKRKSKEEKPKEKSKDKMKGNDAA